MENPSLPGRIASIRAWVQTRRATVIAVATGLLYGLVARIVFNLDDPPKAFAIMTASFIFLVPVAVGFLTVWLAKEADQRSWAFAITAPWATVSLTLGAAFLFALEGLICVVLILPAFMGMGSLGGLAATILRRTILRGRRMHAFALGAVLLFPFAASPVERRIAGATEYRTVANQIRIHADPAAVWTQIARVPRIRPDEYGTSFVHRIGFPRPIEATLSHDGVGGVRRATFERGVLFLETVTVWEPGRTLAFTIHADSSTISRAALDEHVTVGGEHFDVLDGTYRIEQVGPRDVVLHLSSTHRLSTRFNFYSAWWTGLIMSQIQRNILEVVKVRAERQELGIRD